MIKRPIIIDTDPGIDDAVALAIALFNETLDVRLITTVNGILSFDPSYIEVEEKKGLITLTILQDNEITSHLISNMIDLLRQLERDYPKNIMINKEG